MTISERGRQAFSMKGQTVNTSGFLCSHTLSLSQVLHENKWAWLCSNKALFMDTEIWFSHIIFTYHEIFRYFSFGFSQSLKNVNPQGAPGWLSRLSVRLLISAQAVISWFVSLSPTSGSVLTVWGLLGILCLPLPLPLPCQIVNLKKKYTLCSSWDIRTSVASICRPCFRVLMLFIYSQLNLWSETHSFFSCSSLVTSAKGKILGHRTE